MSAETITTVSERFSEPTISSILFVASDRKAFHIERSKLERASDYPPPNAISPLPSEPVWLDEDAETLELLFRYVYLDIPIDLNSLSFSLVEKLAEASHKYIVHTAIVACHAYMMSHASENPLEVISFAARYDYKDIIDAVAPYTIGTELSTIRRILPTPFVLPWVIFNNEYQCIAQDLVARITTLGEYCWLDHDDDESCGLGDGHIELWKPIEDRAARMLRTGGMQKLLCLDKVFPIYVLSDIKECGFCRMNLRSEIRKASQRVENLRKNNPLSTFF